MAASLTGARYLRDAIVADSAEITGSATIGGSVTVTGGLSGNGALLTGLSTWSPAPNTSTSIGIAGVISQINQMVPTFVDQANNEVFGGAVHSPTLGMWVLVGGVGVYSYSGTGIGLYSSPDGYTWTARVSPSPEMWISVAWGNGRFVAVSQMGPSFGTTYATMTSIDGINWTGHNSLIQQIQRVMYNPDRSEFLAFCNTGFSVSTDGITWSAPVQPLAGALFLGIEWSKSLGLYAAITNGVGGNMTAYPFTSPDGITWTQRAGVWVAAHIYTLCWSPSVSLFVAIGQYKWFWSKDGITWTFFNPQCPQGFPLTPNTFARCIWDPDHSVFVAVGDQNGGVAISADGFGWEQLNPAAGFITSVGGGFVAYSSSLKQLLAVSVSSSLSTPYPIVFTANFSKGPAANVTQSTGTGFLGVGLGAVAPIQQLDVGGYVRVQNPYFWGLGSVGAPMTGGIIARTSLASLVSVGNACWQGGDQQYFYALANCMTVVSCCANISPGGSLQLIKTNLTKGMVANVSTTVMLYPTTVVAQNTNYGTTYNYVSVSATVPMTTGEKVYASSEYAILDAGCSYSGAMLFAT